MATDEAEAAMRAAWAKGRRRADRAARRVRELDMLTHAEEAEGSEGWAGDESARDAQPGSWQVGGGLGGRQTPGRRPSATPSYGAAGSGYGWSGGAGGWAEQGGVAAGVVGGAGWAEAPGDASLVDEVLEAECNQMRMLARGAAERVTQAIAAHARALSALVDHEELLGAAQLSADLLDALSHGSSRSGSAASYFAPGAVGRRASALLEQMDVAAA
ncbi:hypothetical protein T492DRAFT_902335, partial [Pavlovales sp. CCMP2436]